MFKNYLTIAFRSMWRAKAHSIINILGLGVGITCCILISLFIKDEWTFDKFHSKAKQIYRAYTKEDWGENQQFFNTVTPFPLGPVLKENFQEVERQTRFVQTTTQVKVGTEQFNETVSIAGNDFFKMFDFEKVKGETSDALNSPNNIVLTDLAARKYFGESDPINKTISIQLGETFEEFTVTSIIRIPTNSSIQFYLLISDLNFPKLYSQQALTSGWFNVNPETYVQLRDGSSRETIEAKFPPLFKTLIGEENFTKSKYKVGLQPLTEIHLDTTFPVGIAPVANAKYSYIMTAVALLILMVACINFVTMSVGKSIKRAKEVGIRKVVGAKRQELFMQFIGEALLVSLVALTMGIIASYFALPLFNELSGKQLAFPINGFLILMAFSLLIIIGLISGSYPALFLSAYKPITILKGDTSGVNTKQRFRKILVGVQLTLSVFLISSTLLMREQLWMLQNKNLGFDKEQLAIVQVNVPRGGRLSARVMAGMEKIQQLKSELQKIQGVLSSCGSSHDFGNGGWTNIGYTDEKGTYRTFNLNTIDEDYISTLKMEMVQGRNFSVNTPSDKLKAIIVNESFMKEYGWNDAIGKRIPGKAFIDHEIIGVVKDFNYSSLYTKVQPLILAINPMIALSGSENININNSPIPKLFIRLQPGNMMSTIDQVKVTWNKISGDEEYAFTFADQTIAAQYRSDENLGRIISIATWLAIVIGCLGLYALASLTLQGRTKEVSIRKVMGANQQSLLLLLSKDFVLLVLASVLISVPITILFIREWLQSFEYRISIGWQVFLLATGVSLLIALLTISYHTFKTIMTQPAESLKHE